MICPSLLLNLHTMVSLKNLPTAEEFQKRVNDRYDGLFHECPNGDRMPFVCCVCDEFILRSTEKAEVSIDAMKKMKDVLSWKSLKDPRRPIEIEKYFQFDTTKSVVDSGTDFLFLKEMCLSPRGVLRKLERGPMKFKFIVCKRCEFSVKKKVYPVMRSLTKTTLDVLHPV